MAWQWLGGWGPGSLVGYSVSLSRVSTIAMCQLNVTFAAIRRKHSGQIDVPALGFVLTRYRRRLSGTFSIPCLGRFSLGKRIRERQRRHRERQF